MSFLIIYFLDIFKEIITNMDSPKKSRFSRLQSLFRRTTAPSRSTFWECHVVVVVVTPLCVLGALENVRVTTFRALKFCTDPVHGLIVGTKKIYFAAHHRIVMIR